MSSGILSAPFSQTSDIKAGAAFCSACFVCLLFISLPIRNLAYLTPFLFIGLQFWLIRFDNLRRTLLWTCVAVTISAISILLDSLSGQRVNPAGLLIGILTYSSLAVLAGLRLDFAIEPSDRRFLTTAVAWWVILQSFLGLFQFVASGEPDAVCGTMGLFDFRGDTFTIAQVYFTFNLFAMILLLMTDIRRLLTITAVALGLLTCAVAHAGHQTLFLMAAIGIVGALQLRPKDAVKLTAVLVVFVGLTATVSSIRWADMQRWYEHVLVDDESPKKMVVIAAGEILSAPKNLLIGAGIGQFGSRAALITSGEYLTIRLPGFLRGESDYFREFIGPAQGVFLLHGEGSAISKPYFSALNTLVEFGLPLTVLLLTALAKLFLDNRRLSRSPDAHARMVGIVANVGLVFFVLCCFVENYLEFPQAIFVPILLYVAAQGSVADRGRYD